MVKIDRLYFLIIVSFFLILFHSLGFLFFIYNLTQGIVLPIKQTVYLGKVSVSNFTQAVFQYPQIDTLIQEIKHLKKENQELKAESSLLKEENKKLRIQLEAPLPPSYSFIPAFVVSLSQKMELAVGEKEGVKAGMPVVDGKVLIGQIEKVFGKRSIVLLLTDPDSKITAITSRGTRGVVVGKGKNTVVLEQVLQKDPLFLGDEVFTTGEDKLPPSLLLGKIAYIKSEDVLPYKEATLSLPLDYTQEQIVFVLNNE